MYCMDTTLVTVTGGPMGCLVANCASPMHSHHLLLWHSCLGGLVIKLDVLIS